MNCKFGYLILCSAAWAANFSPSWGTGSYPAALHKREHFPAPSRFTKSQKAKGNCGISHDLSQLPGMWLQAPESSATSSSSLKSSRKLRQSTAPFFATCETTLTLLFAHSTPGNVQALHGSMCKTWFSKSLPCTCCYCNTKQWLQLVTRSTNPRIPDWFGLEGP